MSIHETQPDIIVKDIMTRPVVTAKETDTVAGVAQLMAKHNIGCVLILGKTGNTIGIITERDVVQRVAAKNLVPSKIKVAETMSKPVVTISSSETITDAARMMNQRKIRRLAVVEDAKLVGVLTMKDILEVTPALIDLVSETTHAGLRREPRETSLAGYCDECETWTDRLTQKDGVFLCQDCSKDLAPSEDET
ncbi:MAG TPA: CBS domain-containing protein [Candidatus Bathyarchaeia archaeon]|nr:CBS domain-containing protein [Candidatus Bathyarchaeia archaeon]